MTLADLSSEFAAEVADLHEFSQDWFTGSNGRSIEEFPDRLDLSFAIVAPTGDVSDRDTIVDLVRSAARSSQMRISTRDARLSYADPVMLGTYTERHESPDSVSERLATAAMVRDDSAPTGFRWLLVHETWLSIEPRT